MKCEVCGHEQCRDKAHGRGDLQRIAEALEGICRSLARLADPVLSVPVGSTASADLLHEMERANEQAIRFTPSEALTAAQPLVSFTAPPGWSYATPGKCACARPDSTHEQWCYFAMRTT